MDSLIPSKAVFFSKPTRVSRLYPVLALCLLLLGSASLYRWQLTQINADTAVQARDARIKQLEGQLTSLSDQVTILGAASQQDKADLLASQTKIQEANAQLTELEQQLKAKASLLAESNTALQTAQSQLLAQQSQLSTNATELEQLRSRPPLFSFQNNSSRSNIAQDQLEVKAVVSSAYDTIQAVYGQPYLLNQITIQFVDSFSIAGSSGEIVISNGSQGISIDIKLKAFSKTSFQDVNTLIHEIVHGFHGVAVLDSSALEEGITVAATDVVMEKMIQAGNLPRFGNLYITLSDEQYAAWNTLLSIKKDNNAFYGYSEVSKAYQLVGKAWLKLYQTNPSFFSQFNSAYYPKIQQGQKATDRLALETISSLVKTVDGQSISQYLSTNQAFNPS